MPRLSCWFVRAALLHLGIGVTLGASILAAKGLPELLGQAWLLLPAHIQLVVGGWLIQLALGMAYWILPRLNASGERGREAWAWASFGMLNTGVLGAAILLTARPFQAAPWLNMLLLPAAALQLLGLMSFVYHAWPRIRPTIALPSPTTPPQGV